MNTNQLSLYEQVVRATNVYLGPAADRFIVRQIQNHLNKPPEQMTSRDLVKLIDWIRVAMSLLTEDTAVVEEYTEKLHQLAANNEKSQNSSRR